MDTFLDTARPHRVYEHDPVNLSRCSLPKDVTVQPDLRHLRVADSLDWIP